MCRLVKDQVRSVELGWIDLQVSTVVKWVLKGKLNKTLLYFFRKLLAHLLIFHCRAAH